MPNGIHLEANLSQLRVVENGMTIKHERWLLYLVIDALVVQVLRYDPLSHHQNGVYSLHRFTRILHRPLNNLECTLFP